MEARGGYIKLSEQFFIFRDGSNVKPNHVRQLLSTLLSRLNLNPELYNTHSLRIGHSSNMLKSGKSLEEIRSAERWVSNAVYKYLKF